MAEPTGTSDSAAAQSKLRRLRPYIVIGAVALVVVVVLIVSSGGSDNDADEASTVADPVTTEGTADDDADEVSTGADPVTTEGAADEGAADPVTTEGTAADDDTDGDDDTGGDDGMPTTDPPEPEYPGIGTDEALANPNCDPETGRIRVPSLTAPPCVVEWPAGADNGGETALGVTGDAIVMVVRGDVGQTNVHDDVRGLPKAWKDVVDVYNHHYEFWGREVRLEFIETSGSTEVAQRADATRAVNDFSPFLVHDATTDGNGRAVFEAEMAARGVIVWGTNVSWQETQDQPGFRWSGQPDDRIMVLHVTEYVGKRVAGDPVQWAGDDLVGEPRRIGMVYTDRWDRDFIDEQVARHGFELAEALSYDEGAESTQRQERARLIVARLRDAGVTTVIAGTDSQFTGTLTQATTDQQWFPEWVMTGYTGQDAPFFARLYDQEQWAHAFGPGPISLGVVGRRAGAGPLFVWHHGREPSGYIVSQANAMVSWAMACLHLAGPDLTAESFRDGCLAYPPSLGSYCDCVTSIGVSFTDDRLPWTDYSGSDDMAEKWWDPTAETISLAGNVQVGAYQFVGNGQRYAVGEWPDDEPRVFDPDVAVAQLAESPPNDTPPDYEHEPHE